MPLHHDPALRATAQAIYEAVYPTDDWAPTGFADAERWGTVHYRQAVDAAQRARVALAERRDRQHRLL